MTKALLNRNGILVLYKGWSPLVVRDSLGFALLFSVFEWSKSSGLPVWFSGGIGGMSFYLSTLPIDRVKAMCMTQNFDKRSQLSAWSCFCEVLRHEGLLGFY